MQFDAWSSEVRKLVAAADRNVRPDELDPNAMYQAFAGGVSPEVFANAPTLPKKSAPPAVAPPVAAPPPSTPMPPAPGTPYLLRIGTDEKEPSTGPLEYLSRNAHTPPGKTKPEVAWAAVIGIPLVLIAVWNVADANFSDGTSSSPLPRSSTTSISSAPVPPPKPLTPSQKLEKAKLAYATWQGDGQVYAFSLSLLAEVPKTDKSHREATLLVATWKDRKRRADARKAEEERVAAAKAERAAKAAAIAAAKQEREEASMFTGDGAVKVAIGKVELHRSTESHTSGKGSTFVFVFVNVAVKNFGAEPVHVNPNDFTLADVGGNTMPPDTDTYGLGNYFDAVSLSPGQQTNGWLVFYMVKGSRYTLTRRGMLDGADVEKPVLP